MWTFTRSSTARVEVTLTRISGRSLDGPQVGSDPLRYVCSSEGVHKTACEAEGVFILEEGEEVRIILFFYVAFVVEMLFVRLGVRMAKGERKRQRGS